MTSRYFIITVDTEGEKAWTYHRGDVIQTTCAEYLPRFQALCNKYGYKPVFLTNYEMICDDYFVRFAKEEQNKGHCEVGIHIHAWNNPPLYELPNYTCDQSFLIEYPASIMRAKFRITYDLITEKMGQAPITHRAGRWVMNSEYFKILEENNIKVDCSYTPYVDWSNTMGAQQGGANYLNVKNTAHWIGNILEVPITILPLRKWLWTLHPKRFIRNVLGTIVWMRPALSTTEQMKAVIDRNKNDFVEFMIHSSELMPGGSPYFRDEQAIEKLYRNMEDVFQYAKTKDYIGCTLKEYYAKKDKGHRIN